MNFHDVEFDWAQTDREAIEKKCRDHGMEGIDLTLSINAYLRGLMNSDTARVARIMAVN